MLAVSTYPQDYIDESRSRIAAQVAAYEKLAVSVNKGADAQQRAGRDFEPKFFSAMILALDAAFVHRLRMKEQKDGNPLNEVRMLSNSILNDRGTMAADKTIKYDPKKSVLKYAFGDEVAVNAAGFKKLSAAFLAEIEAKYRG